MENDDILRAIRSIIKTISSLELQIQQLKSDTQEIRIKLLQGGKNGN